MLERWHKISRIAFLMARIIWKFGFLKEPVLSVNKALKGVAKLLESYS